jgi:hypothetical protein
MARTNRKKLNLAGRIFLSALAIASLAKADTCKIDCTSVGANSSTVRVRHVNGAVEGHDSMDVPFVPSLASPRIDFYSKVPLSYLFDKLFNDARGPNSTTYFDIKIEGAEIPDSVDANLSFQISDSTPPQGNFLWKNLVAELYNSGDVNDCNNLIASYDIKDLVGYGQKIPLTVRDGLSYQLLVKPYNYADLNRDRKVNGLDYAIWANNFGRTNTVPRDANDLGVFSDIDRDNVVDMNDLEYFTPEWLWNADDPNTW